MLFLTPNQQRQSTKATIKWLLLAQNGMHESSKFQTPVSDAI